MFINVFGNKPKAIVRPDSINKTSLSESVVEMIDNSFSDFSRKANPKPNKQSCR
jgi:hypothetical protein